LDHVVDTLSNFVIQLFDLAFQVSHLIEQQMDLIGDFLLKSRQCVENFLLDLVTRLNVDCHLHSP